MKRKWFVLFAAALLCAAVSVQAQGTLPIGSTISVIVDETVSSKNAAVGQKVDGSVAANVTINGKVAIPKGAKANLAVASVASAGKFKGQPKLWLKLVSAGATSMGRPPPTPRAKSAWVVRIVSSAARTSSHVASGMRTTVTFVRFPSSCLTTELPAIFIVVSSATIRARFPSFNSRHTSPTCSTASVPTTSNGPAKS